VLLDAPVWGALVSALVAAKGCGALAASALPELVGGKELFEVFEAFFPGTLPLDEDETGSAGMIVDVGGGLAG
jgi:hypothetical protein